MPKKKESAPADDPARFEQALAELEDIVGEMGGDRVPLDELLKKYERGTALLRLCQGQIASARARIEQIAEQAKNGDVALEPFDPESGGATKSAAGASKGRRDPDTPTPTPDDDIQLL